MSQPTASKPAISGGFFVFSAAATLGLVAVVLSIFTAALPGIIHFDDIGNLSGLKSIADLASAWNWVQEGRAGPLGRPLSLLTFALQYYEWPAPEAFLLWNIYLHTINALLVFWLSIILLRLWIADESRRIVIGFIVALTWAILPFLNSTVLFIVQRMTLLSSTFVLVGLVAYVKLRGFHGATWHRQLLGLSILAGAGLLAMLSKESGALFVIYALVIELLILHRIGARSISFASVALSVGCLSVLMALMPHGSWHECTKMMRGFDVWDRLESQGHIFLIYLKGLFLPLISDLNPFRFEFYFEDRQVSWLGAILWTMAMGLPVVLWLIKYRSIALVCAWFFWGHIMESGWVALEPYFAHRNYLPAVGLIYGFVLWVFSLPRMAGLWRGIYCVYVLLLATIAWMNTSLWGNLPLAAEMWAKEEPRSIRAALNLSYYLERTQGLAYAQDHLDRFLENGKRDSAGLRLQALISACTLEPRGEHEHLLSAVKVAIETGPYEGWATDLVETLADRLRVQECNGVGLNQIAEISAFFLGQPAYKCSAPIVHNLYSMLGYVALENGATEQGLIFLMDALRRVNSYATASVCADIATQEENIAVLIELKRILTSRKAPVGVTDTEWHSLIERVDAALSSSNQ